MPAEVCELAAAAGLTVGPGLVTVACPSCEHEGALRHLTWGAWRCHACDRRRAIAEYLTPAAYLTFVGGGPE